MNVRLKRARELAGYAVQLTKDEGLGTMLARGAGFVRRRCFGKKARYLPAKKVLEAQRAEMAGKNFENCQLSTISVLTPLYNTPEVFLRQFLDSFVNQTAPNGELCLADASDAAHSSVGDIVREYQAKYQHIVYKKIENKGIAANTNAAAELASGEYLALADHDDILAPHAMYTMGQAIRQLREAGEPDGFLYSDEALFTKMIEKPLVAHFKPDYAPDYLLCCNYICHLAVFRRELFEQVGGERPECDGSQDHDLFLRLIEQVGGAAHVPQVLYYWRVHEGSTSGGTDAKPYVAKAAKKALADHLERTGRTGTIEDGLYPSTYRVRWDIVGEPKVSILIPNKDHTEDLEKCLQSIWKKTTWDRFEVIVIENNSTDPATFAYYEKARQRYDGLKVVTYPGKGFNFSAINNFGRKAAEGDYLLLWQNDNTIVVGQNQNTEAEINRPFVEEHHINVVRRSTGGGAVYHDLGNLNYSFITDAGDKESISMARFTHPVVEALKGLGLQAEASGRNDILVEGRKVSGTAQRLCGNRILHHGTLLFDANPDMVAGALQVDPEKFRSKSTKSVRSRIGNIRSFLKQDMDMPAFWAYLKDTLAGSGMVFDALTPQELGEVEKRKAEKYDTWEWNYGRSPACTMLRRRRVDGCGLIEAYITVEHGLVSAVTFKGDFFSAEEPEALAARFVGHTPDRAGYTAALDGVETARYFAGLQADELIDILCEG